MAVNDKFGRNYLLTLQAVDGDPITIAPPFTIEFDIERTTYGSANDANFVIYNLSETSRNKLRFDQASSPILRTVAFAAGYGDNLSVLFSGNIHQAWSVRQGNDYVTNVVCFGAGYAFTNARTNLPVQAHTTQQSIIEAMVTSLASFGVSKGAIGVYSSPVTARGDSYCGNTTDLLHELTGGGFFIDNGKAFCMGDTEAFEGDVDTISSTNGLLGTPVRQLQFVDFEMLFEPRLLVGQRLSIISSESNFNNSEGIDYKVVGLRHKGVISPSVCGSATTTVNCQAGQFKVVPLT